MILRLSPPQFLSAISMHTDSMSYLAAATVAGLAVGAICGLLPFIMARRRGRSSLGSGALITCICFGGILGLILAVPTMVAFSIVILGLGPLPVRRGLMPPFPLTPAPESRVRWGDDQRAVLAPEGDAVAERRAGAKGPGLTGNVVQVACGVGDIEIDRGMEDTIAQAENRGG